METFLPERIAFNDHTQETGQHQPLLVAIEEVVDDPDLRALLIDNCPFQARWSASITPKGAFFCEIAAAQDYLFDGPGGWPVEPGWWKRLDLSDQVDNYCQKCSGALPMPSFSDGRGGRDGKTIDIVSEGNLQRLFEVGSTKAYKGNYIVWKDKVGLKEVEAAMENGWKPREFRSFEAHSPEDVEHARPEHAEARRKLYEEYGRWQ